MFHKLIIGGIIALLAFIGLQATYHTVVDRAADSITANQTLIDAARRSDFATLAREAQNQNIAVQRYTDFSLDFNSAPDIPAFTIGQLNRIPGVQVERYDPAKPGAQASFQDGRLYVIIPVLQKDGNGYVLVKKVF